MFTAVKALGRLSSGHYTVFDRRLTRPVSSTSGPDNLSSGDHLKCVCAMNIITIIIIVIVIMLVIALMQGIYN